MSDIGASSSPPTTTDSACFRLESPLPVPGSSAVSPAGDDILNNYRNLKRRFDELEQQWGTSTSLQQTGQTNEQIEHERRQLAEQIMSLEALVGGAPNIEHESEPPVKKQSGSVSPTPTVFPALDTTPQGMLNFAAVIDPALSGLTGAPPPEPTSSAPTRRSTRARKAINYNDDEMDNLLLSSPKTDKPALRKARSKATDSAPAAPQGDSTSPTPASAPAAPFNPYSLYYPTPGQAPAPFPYHYYYMPGMMPYPPPTMQGMPGPSQIHRAQPQQVQRPSGDSQRKPKRLKTNSVESKQFSIPMVPRDKRGVPMLPLNVGIMTVISLGEVCMREHFHTERYIFPVGYEVTRRYMSTINPTSDVVYHCTILDGGDGPKFQIVPNDVPGKPVIAGTATGAWSSVVKQANAIRNRQHSNSVSGPDFFGLGQNTIKHLIQQLPNADKLRDYVWQHFNEGGPLGGRHAAVIPALPEEYDSSTPIGAFYPTERDKIHKERAEERAASGEAPRNHYPAHIMAQASGKVPGQQLTPPPRAPQTQVKAAQADETPVLLQPNEIFENLLKMANNPAFYVPRDQMP